MPSLPPSLPEPLTPIVLHATKAPASKQLFPHASLVAHADNMMRGVPVATPIPTVATETTHGEGSSITNHFNFPSDTTDSNVNFIQMIGGNTASPTPTSPNSRRVSPILVDFIAGYFLLLAGGLLVVVTHEYLTRVGSEYTANVREIGRCQEWFMTTCGGCKFSDAVCRYCEQWDSCRSRNPGDIRRSEILGGIIASFLHSLGWPFLLPLGVACLFSPLRFVWGYMGSTSPKTGILI